MSLGVIGTILGGLFLWLARHDPAPLAGQVAGALNRAAVTLYLVEDDPESEQQQTLFGPFISELTVVNCTAEPSRCAEAGISDVPAFVFSDIQLEVVGYQSLDDLRDLLKGIHLW